VSYRADALARLDVRAFYEARGVTLGAKVGADEYRFQCPFHDDETPSANLNLVTGLWRCQAEAIGGSPIDFVMLLRGVNAQQAIEEVGEAAGLGPRKGYREAAVEGWHEAGLRNIDLQRWFVEKRGFTPETVAAYQLGWDGERVTIPIRDEAGKLVNVRRYLRGTTGEAGKMLGFAGNNEMRLWPLPVPDREVLLVEGEWDAILARQMGFAHAMTVTSGAGNFNTGWVSLFADHRVTVAYDNDTAGRRGAQKVAGLLSRADPPARVFILQIPNLPDKGDVTDFFVEQGRTPEELADLIGEAVPFIVSTGPASDAPAIEVPLYEASHARHHGQRLLTKVLLSGKAMTPYTVPLKANVHCGMDNQRYCGICPLQAYQGNRDVQLSASSAAALSLVGVSDEQKYKAFKQLAEAVSACNRPAVTALEWTNVEELRLIPEIDRQDEGEAEYVARRAFFIGHGTAPNRGYVVDGYVHPHPKDQSTVHLLSGVEPAQDNISAFVMTPEIDEQLRRFQTPDIDRGWRAIYDDLRVHVHRIQDRYDMQVAFDLAWHSIISFTFNGQYIRRGWVEAMVMSDSGQGKTEMGMALLHHYRLGNRVQGEQSSSAGLLGGLEKMGDNWILNWGELPRNDKRLLIIDETQGINPLIIEGLSDVRATGIAEITKIRTERTNARCRLVWLANPPSGRTLGHHNQGVLAIKELFKKPEDVRRLDLAICLASSDVDFEHAINVRVAVDPAPQRFDSDLCRNLVLWAWSRRPDQVTFTDDATSLILAEATTMGRRYHPSIPLVEPADQRLKLARLSAAAAARVYSTDDGERLVVANEHVRFVLDYLERVYNSPAMSYGEYSSQEQRHETLTSGEMDSARSTIEAWSNAPEALAFFRQTRIFTRADLENGIGWAEDYAKGQLRFLTGARLISRTREGYRKTPAFITLLRGLSINSTLARDVDAILARVEEEGAAF
jgi:hypothetical protein